MLLMMTEQWEGFLKKLAEAFIYMLDMEYPPVADPLFEFFNKQSTRCLSFKVGFEFLQITDECLMLGFVECGIDVVVHDIVIHVTLFGSEVVYNVRLQKQEKCAEICFGDLGVNSAYQSIDAAEQLTMLLVNLNDTDRKIITPYKHIFSISIGSALSKIMIYRELELYK